MTSITLCYSAISGSSVADYGQPSRVDMGNVGPYTVDHVVPKARGGTDHIENLQLLCGACSVKGTKT